VLFYSVDYAELSGFVFFGGSGGEVFGGSFSFLTPTNGGANVPTSKPKKKKSFPLKRTHNTTQNTPLPIRFLK